MDIKSWFKKLLYGNKAQNSIFLFLFLLFSFYLLVNRNIFSFEKKKTDWPRRINDTLKLKKSGKFLAKDKHGVDLIIEWDKTGKMDQDYLKNTNKISEFFCTSRVDVQMNFFKKHPEKCPDILKEFLAKDFSAKTQEGAKNFEEIKKRALQLGKLKFSPDFSDQDDMVFFVNLMDRATGKTLGCVIFGIGGYYEYGDIFIRDIVSLPESRDRGIGKVLASSIFKILPYLKKLKVYVLDTNENAKMIYKLWGFEEKETLPEEKREGNILMEYDIENSNNLQQASGRLEVL